MKKITFVAFLCMLMTVPIAWGQTSLTSTHSGNSTVSIKNGPAGTATIKNNPAVRAPLTITHNATQNTTRTTHTTTTTTTHNKH